MTAVRDIAFVMGRKTQCCCVVCSESGTGQDRRLTCNITFRRSRLTIFEVEKKQLLHILSVLIFALVIGMQCKFAVLYCDCLSHFSTLFHKEQDCLRKIFVENKMCFWCI